MSEESRVLDYLRTDASVPSTWTGFTFDFTAEVGTASAVLALELAGYGVDVLGDDVDLVAHP